MLSGALGSSWRWWGIFLLGGTGWLCCCLGARCPPGQFPGGFGHPVKCCNECRTGHQLPCPDTKDPDCKCPPGSYCGSEVCPNCVPFSCKKGEEIQREGKFDFSFSCSPCPRGTYSNGDPGRCTPWIDCQTLGFLTVQPGNSTHNTLCAPPVIQQRDTFTLSSIFLPVLTAVAIFILILITIFLHLYIWQFKNKKVHKMEDHEPSLAPRSPDDAYSCQFPEEERGDKTAEEKARLGSLWV
ncbi:tumor necrosis factor receptor superfamily member 18 [Tachyglossus aculeatus]|uniref:tumor necrosis factor receptor superfamily member 18 n=1 Tax=Tachyglossus aculeatus TaxID=9261 RepID=UPI0018F718EE|nr:tumor necrosis factor receptor superfamily member 18 [Tachyglossus aculeatus]